MKSDLRREGDLAQITVEGDVDMHVVADLRKTIKRALQEKPKTLVVDLGGVEFMDSSGIAVLVEGLKLLRATKGALRLVRLTETVRDTIDVAGLTQILGVEEDPGE